MAEQPVTIETNYIGVVDGLQTWEVINTDTGEVIGYNQTLEEINGQVAGS